jgi:hypothetical protein
MDVPRREMLGKLGAIALGLVVIGVSGSAGIYGIVTGRNVVMSVIGLGFAVLFVGMLVWRWVVPGKQ